jgi:hypothetical protein
MIKVIIAGGRKFNDYKLLETSMDKLLVNYDWDQVEIVSGKASGADTLGERYANSRGMSIKEFPADWENYGNYAGPIRNALMADYATHCAVFWDGYSRGSANMINVAKAAGLKVKVIHYKA